MFVANSSNHEDTNTHDNDRDMGMRSIGMYTRNTDMERDRRKQVPVVLDERQRHIQKENPVKSILRLFFSLAISFRFMKNFLYFPWSLFSAYIKVLNFTNLIFHFFQFIKRMGLKSVDTSLNLEGGLAIRQNGK